MVVVDLENAVAPPAKTEARRLVACATDHVDPARLVVRLNSLGSPHYAEDVAMLAGTAVRTVMVPKVRAVDDMERVAHDLPGVEAIGLCESATAILGAREIAAADNCAGLMWGGEDLVVDLAGTVARHDDGWLAPAMRYARAQLRFATRAADVLALEPPLLRIDRPDWVTQESRAAAAMGYHAKACIHPDHVPLIRAAFAPTEDEIAHANAIVSATVERTGDNDTSDVAVFALDGLMVDQPVVMLARQVLARAALTH